MLLPGDGNVGYDLTSFVLFQEPDSKLAHSSLVFLLGSLSDIPEKWRTALRNNAGGYVNHIFYWNSMCSVQDRTHNPPAGKIAEDIKKTFGSFDEFKRAFTLAGSSLFGSGYVWLVEARDSTLSITTTHNQVYTLTILSLIYSCYYIAEWLPCPQNLVLVVNVKSITCTILRVM